MKTSFGKLTVLALVLTLGILLFAPMRSGVEDRLVLAQKRIQLNPGDVSAIEYELQSEEERTVEFVSANPAVVQVDSNGRILAVAPGSTQIKLKAKGGLMAEVDVSVSGVPVTSFELNTDVLEMVKGEVSGLSYRFNHGATMPQVQWQSVDPSVAEVDAAGRVSAVGGGETYIVASAPGGLNDSALVRVRVESLAVQIAPADLCVGAGTSLRLEADLIPGDATDEVERWVSSNPAVLTVDADGTLRAVSVGTAEVSVTTKQGLTAASQVRVEPAAQGLQLSPSSVTLERGSTVNLTAGFITAAGETEQHSDHYLRWSSSEPRIASVENGVVTGHSSGVVMIYAESDGFRSSCKVHVKTSVQEVHLNIEEQYFLREQTDKPFQLRAEIIPADADNRTLKFTSDNELVAAVSPSGLVTLTGGYGTAVITAEAESGAQAQCTISVVTELPKVQPEPETPTE